MPLRAANLPPQLLMPLLFLANGLFLRVWIASIPEITAAVGLDRGATGRVLSMFPLGALVAFPLVAMVIRLRGSRGVLLIFAAIRAATFLPLALASSESTLAVALACVEFAHGGLDLALNAQAVAMERHHGCSLLPRAHAEYAIGTFSGSLGAGVLEGAGVAAAPLLLVPIALASVVYGTARTALVADIPHGPDETGRRAGQRRWSSLPLPPFPLLVLLAIAFIVEIGDEAISDWYALYLREDLQSLPAVATMEFPVFTAGILVGRIAGDPLTRGMLPARVLQLCGSLAGTGMVLGLAGTSPSIMLASTFITGLGFSLILPILYREAGAVPGVAGATAMAMMSTAVNLGFMVGPLIIGPFSDATSLRFALAMVGVMFFTIPALGQLLLRAEPVRARLSTR